MAKKKKPSKGVSKIPFGKDDIIRLDGNFSFEEALEKLKPIKPEKK